jgi:glycine/D-amino acid oxidase-like deaminating enzyme
VDGQYANLRILQAAARAEANDLAIVMGYSSDGLPHVGCVPGNPGQFVLAGFTGHGMPQIFLAAEGVAKMIVRGIKFKDTELPKLFETTQARLDSQQSNILSHYPRSGDCEARL